MKQLAADIFAGPQLMPGDLARLAADGFKTIINNRPDGEAPMQPSAQEMSEAAKALGLEYYHIPMSGGIDPATLQQTIEAYASSPKPIAAYCTSGTRSAALWCFAAAPDMGVDGVLEACAKAGFQLEQLKAPLTAYLEQKRES